VFFNIPFSISFVSFLFFHICEKLFKLLQKKNKNVRKQQKVADKAAVENLLGML